MQKIQTEILDWLLEESNPSVRYFTLKDLMGFPDNNPEVIQAKSAIHKTGPVPDILSKQNPGGYWDEPQNYYVRTKYHGTAWSFLLLAQLGADGTDPRVQSTAEFLFRNAWDPGSGTFTYRTRSGVPAPDATIPCLTGNMTWCMIRFGYRQDERVNKAVKWMTDTLRFDDGDGMPPDQWPYIGKDNCWGKHTCHMAVIKTLKALAEIPSDERSSSVLQTIQQGVDFLLRHHIFKRSHNLDQIAKPEWLDLGFPLMWDSDILEVLEILLHLGIQDERMQPALDEVQRKRQADGRWLLERTYNGRYQVRIEKKGKPAKWVTLKALTVLKRSGALA